MPRSVQSIHPWCKEWSATLGPPCPQESGSRSHQELILKMEASAEEATNNKMEAGSREVLEWSCGRIRPWVQYEVEGCGKKSKRKKREEKEDKAIRSCVLFISLSWPTPQKQRDRGHVGGLCRRWGVGDNWEAAYTGEGSAGGSSPHTQVRCWWGQRTKQKLSEEADTGQDSSRD